LAYGVVERRLKELACFCNGSKVELVVVEDYERFPNREAWLGVSLGKND
jgi:hypothetical protein